jgi:phosphoribosyl-AMP cyclohydrolase
MSLIDEIKFDDRGLVPAIAQEAETGDVLMMAYMSRESVEKTLEDGLACYFSRSRNKLWVKGETSGNIQRVKEIRLDCDGDTLLLLIDQTGPACHTGERSCFFRKTTDDGEVVGIDV